MKPFPAGSKVRMSVLPAPRRTLLPLVIVTATGLNSLIANRGGRRPLGLPRRKAAGHSREIATATR